MVTELLPGLFEHDPGRSGGATAPLKLSQGQEGFVPLAKALGEMTPQGVRLDPVLTVFQAATQLMPQAPVIRIALQALPAEGLELRPVPPGFTGLDPLFEMVLPLLLPASRIDVGHRLSPSIAPTSDAPSRRAHRGAGVDDSDTRGDSWRS